MSDIKDWSTVATNNNAAAPNGYPEGMAPGDVNNADRETLAAVRRYYDDSEWREWGHTIAYGSTTTFTTAAGDGDTTAIYHANRRVRAVGTLTGTIYGTISGSVHTTSTTVTVVWDSGTLNNESLTISIGVTAAQAHIPVSAIADTTIPVGTVMAFFQSSVPTGWTQVVTQNDKALRVVSGTGGGTAGTHGLSTPPSANHTHTGPNHTHTGPSHTHGGPTHNHIWSNSESPVSNTHNSAGNVVDFYGGENNDGIAFATSNTLANATHYTSMASGTTGFGGTGSTGFGGTGNTGTGTLTAFAPLYIDVVIGSKN